MNTAMAQIILDGHGLIGFTVGLVIAALIFWLLFWLIDYAGLPQPFNKVVKVVLAVVAVLYLINALLAIAGHSLVIW